MLATVASRSRAGGIDLVWPFLVGDVNARLEPMARLAGEAADLGLLFASTRFYWLRFAAAVATEPERAREADPVDRHVVETITSALAPFRDAVTLRFAHESPPLPIQRIAEYAGFARLSPGRLSVHPVYGPWIALRGVAVVGVPGPTGPSWPLRDPCPGCRGGCDRVLARATAARERPDSAALAENWRAWLAVRDACPVGREHRYSEEQIRYGYTKDRAVIAALAHGPADSRTGGDHAGEAPH